MSMSTHGDTSSPEMALADLLPSNSGSDEVFFQRPPGWNIADGSYNRSPEIFLVYGCPTVLDDPIWGNPLGGQGEVERGYYHAVLPIDADWNAFRADRTSDAFAPYNKDVLWVKDHTKHIASLRDVCLVLKARIWKLYSWDVGGPVCLWIWNELQRYLSYKEPSFISRDPSREDSESMLLEKIGHLEMQYKFRDMNSIASTNLDMNPSAESLSADAQRFWIVQEESCGYSTDMDKSFDARQKWPHLRMNIILTEFCKWPTMARHWHGYDHATKTYVEFTHDLLPVLFFIEDQAIIRPFDDKIRLFIRIDGGLAQDGKTHDIQLLPHPEIEKIKGGSKKRSERIQGSDRCVRRSAWMAHFVKEIINAQLVQGYNKVCRTCCDVDED